MPIVLLLCVTGLEINDLFLFIYFIYILALPVFDGHMDFNSFLFLSSVPTIFYT